MSLFKKKENIPTIYDILNAQVEEAKEKGKTSFYYPLKNFEIKQAEAWALHNHYWLRISHKSGEDLIYKISGFLKEALL